MVKITYLLFGLVTLSGYLAQHITKYFALLPELMSVVIFFFVLLKLGIERSVSIRRPYLILAGFAVLHVFAGVLINEVSPGAVINGLRPHVKWLPIFLLPVAYRFTDRQIARQLKFLLFLALMQCPVALYQFFIEFRNNGNGDDITGTMGFGGSGILSVFLIAAMAVLVSSYVAARIRTTTFLFLMVCLFLPTTINETKATLFLLPVALFVPFLYGGERKLNAPSLIGLGALLALLIAGYGVIYDSYVTKNPYGVEIGKFFSNEKAATEYLYSGADLSNKALKKDKIGQVKYPTPMLRVGQVGRRLDNILLPLRALSDDPVRLFVGVGVGNVSSGFRHDFSGEYSQRLSQIAAEDLWAFQLWETGIGGVILFLILLYLLIKDTHRVARSDKWANTLAKGWIAVLVIVLMTLPYTQILQFNAVIYAFAYFSGYIASQRFQFDARSTEDARPPKIL